MRLSVPHPIPYQGSKRRLAGEILKYLPAQKCRRLVEPFAGSAAVTLAAASESKSEFYVIGDILEPLVQLWNDIINSPNDIADQYELLWHHERSKPIEGFYEIRAEFNEDRNPAKLLYLLVRCVKNAVRFNPAGEFNQSPDKRRKGTHPQTMRKALLSAHRILVGKCEAVCTDFMTLCLNAERGDFFYLDPPYQGTSYGRDQRYFSSVDREKVIEALTVLNEKKIPFVLSYDGYCGDRIYGEPLPSSIGYRVLIDAGRSSQATLNGLSQQTTESLYLSHLISVEQRNKAVSASQEVVQVSLFA